MGECCAPGAGRSTTDGDASGPGEVATPERANATGRTGMVDLDGGRFLMGSEGPEANDGDGEGPQRQVAVGAFRLDETAVTNRQFARFAKETGYVTTAEEHGWSFVFQGLATQEALAQPDLRRVQGAYWWLAVSGASWRQPDGPGSEIGTRPQHPVVHVSHLDALAYCAWAGTRLPTEAEWEYAARAALVSQHYPWGSELTPRGKWRCNIWQGSFPKRNLEEDGHLGPAPVRTYSPNGFGLFEMTGNVWEWTADRWSFPDGSEVAPDHADHLVRKGGSYLCHDSYCNRYRNSARDHSAPEDTTGNVGFRCAADALGVWVA